MTATKVKYPSKVKYKIVYMKLRGNTIKKYVKKLEIIKKSSIIICLKFHKKEKIIISNQALGKPYTYSIEE